MCLIFTSYSLLLQCYVLIKSDPSIPKISGGKYQEYSHAQTISMDGSQSVDLSVHPKKDQNLSYIWRCSSDDGNNEFCKTLNQTGKRLNHIPYFIYYSFWYSIS